MNTIAGQFRQGDVLIELTQDAIPAGATKVKLEGGRVILAHGNATGHSHAIDGKCASMWRTADDTLVVVKKATAVRHEEHDPIPLVPGTYRITRQREYHPEAIRWVVD